MDMSLLKVNVHHIMKFASKFFMVSHLFGEEISFGTMVILLPRDLVLVVMGSNCGNRLYAQD